MEDTTSKAWLSGAAHGMASGTAQLPYALLRYYHQLGLSDAEVLLLIQLLGFRQAEFNEFPMLEELAGRMGLAPEGIARMLQRLMKDGYISIDEHRDEERDIQYERYDLHGLYTKLATCTAEELATSRAEQRSNNSTRSDSNSVQKEEEERNMFSIFEKEFGRPLSPMECETISGWLDQDRYQEELILMALKEAVFAGKVHFRYIDRILLEWSRNRVKNVQDAKAYTQRFRSGGR
ncbi:DNA replication protein DnaD [Paenibacillus sp. PCH8]|uniref:DnaD domain-containing protein n=1 Tax=Paenibacillus sp. PCH8 TaxID=2066524 RepID=UPI000CFA47D0|nr:DnaD domain-containing protein [Paenibacillus sp. PCH8]PQP81989.1 DNA replication protein DnaD [Paenibacillus sp. PCH8]